MAFRDIAAVVVFLLLAAFLLAQAASIPGTVVSSKITTGDTANTHSIGDTNEMRGTPKLVDYSTHLREISTARSQRGMFAYAHDSGKVYILYSTPGFFWREWQAGSGDISGKLDSATFRDYTAVINRTRRQQHTHTRFDNLSVNSISVAQGSEAQTLQLLEALADGSNAGLISVGNLTSDHTLLITDSGLLFDGALVSGSDYSAKLDSVRFVNFSGHWGKHDDQKLDVERFLAYSALGRSTGGTTDISGKLDSVRFTDYSSHWNPATWNERYTTVPRHQQLSTAVQTKVNTRAHLTHGHAATAVTYGKYSSPEVDTALDRLWNRAQQAQGPAGYTPQLGVDYWDARERHILRCQIVGGSRGISYNTDNTMPMPATLDPFTVYLYSGSEVLTAAYWLWWVPAENTALRPPEANPQGTQSSQQTYTPLIHSRYSSTYTNNYIAVQVGYSSAEGWGRDYCTTSVNVAVNRRGEQGPVGPAGPQGPQGGTSALSVLSAFTSARNYSIPLYATPATADRNLPLAVYRDYTGNARHLIYPARSEWRTPGKVNLSLDSTGTLYVLKNNANKIVIANEASLTMYADNGTTILYRIDPLGRWYGSEGEGSVGQCLISGGSGANKTWGSCGSGGGSVGGSNGQLQVNRAGVLAGIQLRYSSITADSTMFKFPSGIRKMEIRNAANRSIMTLYSSTRVVIGGS